MCLLLFFLLPILAIGYLIYLMVLVCFWLVVVMTLRLLVWVATVLFGAAALVVALIGMIGHDQLPPPRTPGPRRLDP